MADVSNDLAADISAKLNVLIALTLRQMSGQKGFAKSKRNTGAGEIVHFLAEMGLDAKDIAIIIGSPVTSVRTLLTPKRRK
jgi:hypothetical protein